MSTISRSLLTSPRPAAARIDSKLLAWTLFAVGVLVIVIFAVAVSPPLDVDNLMTIGLIGP